VYDIVRQVSERCTNYTLLLSVQALYCTSDLILLCLSHDDSLIRRFAGLTTAKFLNFLLPVLGFALLRVAKAFIIFILCDV